MSHAFTNKQLRTTCSTSEQLPPRNSPDGPGGMGRALFPPPGHGHDDQVGWGKAQWQVGEARRLTDSGNSI